MILGLILFAVMFGFFLIGLAFEGAMYLILGISKAIANLTGKKEEDVGAVVILVVVIAIVGYIVGYSIWCSL